MGLTQKEAAILLDVNPWTVRNWEKGHTEPPNASITTIIRFLGYDPFPEPKTLPEHLLAKRRTMGWLIKQAAELIGVDPASWSKSERGNLVLYRQHRVQLANFLSVSAVALDSETSERWNRLHERTPDAEFGMPPVVIY